MTEVVTWADMIIAREPSPDPAVIDVALSGSRSPADMVTQLREVPGDADPIVVSKGLLGRFLDELTRNPAAGQRIAGWLYQLAAHGELPEAVFGWEAYALEDEFELARSGVYGSHEEAVARLRAYLERFSRDAAD